MAVRENKTLGGFLGAVSRSDADVAALKREKMELVDTVDQLQKQNKALQKTLKATSEIIAQKDAQIAELMKANQEGFGATNDRFFMGQATMLLELIKAQKLYIEPKGQYLSESLYDISNGKIAVSNFEGIKSGLLSYVPRISQPENGLSL